MADNWMLKAVISANAEGMLKTLKSVNQATRTTRKYLLDVGRSATNLAGQIGMPLGLIGGALSAFSIAGVQRAVTGFTELTGQISDSAKGVGLSAAEYQRMTFIAGQSGIAADALGASFGRLNKNVALAAAGKNKELAGLFARTGIDLRDSNGRLRTATELLPEVADLFARNKNAATQARMGNVLYGKSWQALAPLLNDGSKGIADLTARYKYLGIEIDENAVEAGERFGDSIDQLKLVTQSYGNTITAKLLPTLEPLLDKTIAWAVANRDLIATNVSNFISEMATSLSQVDWSGVIKGIGDFVKGCKDLIEWIGGAKNALIALVVVMNAQAVVATLALFGAIGRLGLAFLGLALKALAPVAPLQIVTTGMKGANLQAALLTNTLGRLAAMVGVVGAAWGGWEIGKFLNEYVIDPAVQKFSGNKDASLGTWIYDLMHPDDGKAAVAPVPISPSAARAAVDAVPLAANRFSLARAPGEDFRRPSLLQSTQTKVGGEIKVSFKDAPPGMRVEQAAAGPVALNTDVGYRFDAFSGAAY